jgi:hypothetical protein
MGFAEAQPPADRNHEVPSELHAMQPELFRELQGLVRSRTGRVIFFPLDAGAAAGVAGAVGGVGGIEAADEGSPGDALIPGSVMAAMRSTLPFDLVNVLLDLPARPRISDWHAARGRAA